MLKSREIDRSILLMGQVAPIRIRRDALTVTLMYGVNSFAKMNEVEIEMKIEE